MALVDTLHDALRKDTHDSSNTVTPTTPKQKHIQLAEPNPPGISHDSPGPNGHKFHLSESQHPVYGQVHPPGADGNHAQPDGVDSEDELRPRQEQTSKSLSRRLSGNGGDLAPYRSSPNTPAQRTGPPRSLSFAYALPASPSLMSSRPSQTYFQHVKDDQLTADTSLLTDLEADHIYSFHNAADEKDFRGALEYRDQQERERELRILKRRQHRRDSGSWDINPRKWFQESPKEEKPSLDLPVPPAASEAHPPEIKHEGADEGHLDASHSEPEGSGTGSFFLRRRSPNRGGSAETSKTPPNKQGARLRRAFSVPHVPRRSPSQGKEKERAHDDAGEQGGAPMSAAATTSTAKWGKLRALLPHIAAQPQESTLPGPSQVTGQAVNITDELITGGLSMLMLRLWLDRDEKNQRRIPILFHRLRIRISDSLHPMEKHGSAVFRIECEYANGAARWVVYRELRDFLSLHTHYVASNIYNQNVDKMPEFPKTSIPYFKFLKKEIREKGDGTKVDRADFARLQREALENYLVELIRAVMFHPSSNRLAGFLEISALSIALAQSGGAQYKAGLLKIEFDSSSGGGFGRKSVGWREKKNQRWCAVRESYLVVLEEPGELAVWDVFLLDSDFKIERPKRYYRQGLGNLLHAGEKLDDTVHQPLSHRSHEGADPHSRNRHRDNDASGIPDEHEYEQDQGEGNEHDHEHNQGEGKDHANNNDNGRAPSSAVPHIHLSEPTDDHERRSVISSIRTRVSKIFHLDPSKGSHASTNERPRRHASPLPGTGTGTGTVSSDVSSDETSSTGSSRGPSRPPTPMLDPSTNANPLVAHEDAGKGKGKEGKEKEKEEEKGKRSRKPESDVSKHTFYIVNSQMRLKLNAKTERQMLQFITALEKTAATSHYTGSNRFNSFAPIRLNVSAQWLVDGRDYFWNLSRAILLAKESIYIHDWWLSPELLMRRPGKDKYRLDRLLERKAKEGVKIYVILYQEVSNRTTPTDSNYAKQRLLGLHPNVMVQRSPSHFQTGTFYWAHHEKMCVIDQTIAFMGGLDLSFGRWDTPQHVLTDDTAGSDRPEIWPGKDYSNPRLSDFYNLNKHEEDMYDRAKVPRMPWHDVAMQIVGQPARDLARHFVQRWNYLLRIKNHSRIMPFLLPPPEFRPGELSKMGLTGTCELQICRSAGPWSLGTPGKIEHSIQNAYLKAIQMSEHFVYIENQFFITSTVVSDVKIENNIGDAIVHRIIRAHRDGSPWKCCIMIPVLPGFTFPVDHSDASAIRIILECQNRTIARGPNSIYSRLRKEGIDPDDYISVFSLRNWAKMRGDVLTTEQVYIHAKVCIVDDRLAIIGSANINERSQRGDRDSELAAVIRDTDMVDSTMAGKPFKVGRFAHTLRVRLMREHLGIDVDALDEEDLMSHTSIKPEHEQEAWDPDSEQAYGQEGGVTHIKRSKQKTRVGSLASDAKDSMIQAVTATGEGAATGALRVMQKMGMADQTVNQNAESNVIAEERTDFNSDGQKERGFASSVVPTLEEKIVAEQRPPREQTDTENAAINNQERASDDGHQTKSYDTPSRSSLSHDLNLEPRTDDSGLFGAPAMAKSSTTSIEPPGQSLKSDADEDEAKPPREIIRDNLGSKSAKGHHWTVPTKKPRVGPGDFEDPISDTFWKNIWLTSAVHNTEIYRKVFHAIPDDLITTWKQYKEFVAWHERLNKPTRGSTTGEPIARIPSEEGDEGAHESQPPDTPNGADIGSEMSKEDGEAPPTPLQDSTYSTNPTSANPSEEPSKPRRSTKGSEPFEKWERDEMERLLEDLNGQLVLYPTRFLEGEDIANNFLFNADRLLPLPIYV